MANTKQQTTTKGKQEKDSCCLVSHLSFVVFCFLCVLYTFYLMFCKKTSKVKSQNKTKHPIKWNKTESFLFLFCFWCTKQTKIKKQTKKSKRNHSVSFALIYAHICTLHIFTQTKAHKKKFKFKNENIWLQKKNERKKRK